MKIIRFENDEILSEIVAEKSKYQKVMLIYGEDVSTTHLNRVIDIVKGYCIFNKTSIYSIDETELFNGYRLIIWICSAKEMLTIKINRSEFINVYYPQDNYVLPFFVDENAKVKKNQDYLLVKDNCFDISAKSSLYFNNFYKHLIDILSVNENDFDNEIFKKDITTREVLSKFENVLDDCKLLDIEIIKEQNIACGFLPLVDLALIDAFLVFISSVKNKTLTMVDVYKAVKGQEWLIDKFYALSNNSALMSLIILNYNCIYNACIKTKEKILDSFNIQIEMSNEDVCEILNKIKNFCKLSQDIESCLYIFDVFSL